MEMIFSRRTTEARSRRPATILLSAYPCAVVHARRMRIVMGAIRGVVTARRRTVQPRNILGDHFYGVGGKFGLRFVMQKK